jgi:arylsulfatase
MIDQPYPPEDGYHLSKDLVDKAIAMIADGKQVAPDKPFYMYLTPGASAHEKGPRHRSQRRGVRGYLARLLG